MKTALFILSFISLSVFAQDAVVVAPQEAIPSWVAPTIAFLKGLPYVGSWFVSLLGHIVSISAILTAITGVLDVVIKALESLGQLKYLSVLQKVSKYLAIARPYVGYFAMQNVQKK